MYTTNQDLGGGLDLRRDVGKKENSRLENLKGLEALDKYSRLVPWSVI